MSILNNAQLQSYNAARTLFRFLHKNKRICTLLTPFCHEVNNLQQQLSQIPAYATTKTQRGNNITLQKQALKKEIATDGAYLCNMVTVYAIHTNNIKLKENIHRTYTDIFTLKDGEVLAVTTIITDTIKTLLAKEDFIPYGITAADLTSLLEKGKRYDDSIGSASIVHTYSLIANANITQTLKQVKATIGRLKRMLAFFRKQHPAFVSGFLEAAATSRAGIRHNVVEGIITNASTGQPAEEVSIVAKGKNKTAITGSNGFYYLPNLTTGRHNLTITAKGYATQVITITIIRGKTITQNIHLESALTNVSKAEVA